MSIRVVIADDHPMFSYGLRAVLDQTDQIDVVGTAADGESLVRLVEEHRPDVVITDLTMPGTDGVTATARLVQQFPDLAVLVLTMHEDDEHVFAALRAGARGYLLKGADAAEIARTVMAVADGDAVYGGAVGRRIVASLATEASLPSLGRTFPDLTPREREVLELVAAGCRNHEIARRLGMSDKTVRNHVSQILLKLKVPDRTAAALKVRDAGL